MKTRLLPCSGLVLIRKSRCSKPCQDQCRQQLARSSISIVCLLRRGAKNVYVCGRKGQHRLSRCRQNSHSLLCRHCRFNRLDRSGRLGAVSPNMMIYRTLTIPLKGFAVADDPQFVNAYLNNPLRALRVSSVLAGYKRAGQHVGLPEMALLQGRPGGQLR